MQMPKPVMRLLGGVPNIRWLAAGIIAVTFVCATVAAVFAQDDFPTYGKALWWAVQTVTTVGYGDITPETPEGQVIAAILMVSAVALISVITASISAAFIRRLQGKRGDDPVMGSLDHLHRRLDEIEKRLKEL
ncbi:MAG TPA: potassium channel family protein [Gaiellaceae bacterium]|jgi:voltage-gated potassium channel